MEKLTFKERKVTHERTHTVEGKVLFAEDYITKDKSIPGVAMQIEGVPYTLRALKGSIKGAGSASTLIGCTVKINGDLRTYEGQEYLNPRDVVVIHQSGLAKIASAGVAYAGSLD